MQQLHRHGIEHLVAEQHPVHALGQPVVPMHPASPGLKAQRLAFTQRGRQLDHMVGNDAIAQLGQQLRRHCAGACTELPYLARVAGPQRLSHLHGERAAEQR
jgi:hypothetical protein